MRGRRQIELHWIVNDNECWIVVSHKPTSAGYISITRNGIRSKAHRVMYEKYKGNIPKGKLVLHRCDNPKCVNPEHLFLGTATDNRRDCVQKGRQAKGEKQGMSKLTVKQVLEIRKKYVKGINFHKRGNKIKLAKKYGIHPEYLLLIVKKEWWAWL